MRINHNAAAFNAFRHLTLSHQRMTRSLERLSSGLRINRAADDPSGLVRSESLRSKIGGLRVATRNAQDAISLVQTAEGAMAESHTVLQRMRDLTVQSGNLGTNDRAALAANQNELTQLQQELDRINRDTRFGTIDVFRDLAGAGAGGTGADAPLELGSAVATQPGQVGQATALTLTVPAEGFAVPEGYEGQISFTLGAGGLAEAITFSAEVYWDAEAIRQAAQDAGATASFSGNVVTFEGAETATSLSLSASIATTSQAVFQVGANAGQRVSVPIRPIDTQALELTDLDIGPDTSPQRIDAALRAIDRAIGSVSANRAEPGAVQNRMEATIRSLSVSVENLSAAESRIRDADMAMEMMEFTRSQILVQAGTAMLAQANLLPQMVLSLLRP